MRYALSVILCIISCVWLSATEYKGRVVDEQGNPVPFATVYLEQNPMIGTATNNDGVFTFQADVPDYYVVVVSFIGYEKQHVSLPRFAFLSSDSQSSYSADSPSSHSLDSPSSHSVDSMEKNLPTVVLREQPIALEETVVMAKEKKQKNKRKAMAELLYKVYNRMQYDFSDEAYAVRLVSDVQMQAEHQPWGMEQMIARVVTLPKHGQKGKDSVQFSGEYCKRFFKQTIRNRADTILAGSWMPEEMRRMATEVDSGVVVHRSLWAAGNIRYDFEEAMKDIRHWTVSRESETETVLTHTAKKNYLGIFKYAYRRHYIVDSDSYRVLRFSEQLEVEVHIPFGYKLKKEELEMLNLLNMQQEGIEKFRLRHATAQITLNTIYQTISGYIYPAEKNLKMTAQMVGKKEQVIPVEVKATQHVSELKPNALPMAESELTKRIDREIVPIY